MTEAGLGQPQPVKKSPTRILIVEDDFTDASIITKLLRKAGYSNIEVAVDASAALEAARKKQYDVALVDFVLPGGKDGAAIAAELSERFNLPSIFVTGKDDERMFMMMSEAEGYGCLRKPLDPLSLHATIQLTLSNHRLYKELHASNKQLQRLSEYKIQQSERRLSLSLEAANVGLWDLSLKNRSVYFSPTWFGMLGYEPDELPCSFDTWSDLLHPDDRERVLEQASEVTSGASEDYEQTFRMRTKSGEYRWILSTGKVMTRDEQGNPLNMLGTHVDITDLKRAESEAQDAKTALESTLNALPDLLFEVDREGRRYGYFAADRSLLFREPEQFLGKTVRETLPADTAEIIMQAIAEAAVHGSHLGAVYSLDLPTGRKWFELSISAKGDIADPDCRFIILARDVTQRHEAEESLKRIQWMLSPHAASSISKDSYEPAYGDLVALNQSRLILDTVGQEALTDIVMDYLSMLGTSAAVYESNGDYALGIFSSGWCRFMDQASRNLCGTADNQEALASGKWLCHESCWSQASQKALETGEPTDIACAGGLRLYALPISAGGKHVGVINFGHGDPPTDPEALRELAELYQVDQEELSALARSYESRPPFIVELAKRRLASAASLIGQIVERRQAEEAIRRVNRELEALWSVSTLEDASLKEISDHILDNLVSMTDSAYGFYGFMDESENTMAIHSWSGQAMADCAVVDQPLHFSIEQAGVWGEAVRRREPLIINDFSAGHQGMKGTPAGHVELANLLVVPFFSEGKIVSLAAVANRNRDYGSKDVAQINSFLASVQAVIERRQAKRALAESEQRLDLALESVNDAVWEWRIDTGEVYFSPRWFRMLGYEPSELPQEFDTWRSLLHPDDRGATETTVMEHVESAEQFEIEFRMRAKRGGWRWILGRGKVVEQGQDGKAVRMLGTHSDITERKKAEEELRYSKALLDTTGRMARVGGWELDAQTLEVTWTEETYRIHEVPLGYKPPLEGAINFWHPDDRERLTQAIQMALEKGEPYDLELRFITAKGRNLWARTVCRPEVVEGRTVRLQGTFQDITDRKRAERERNKLREQLNQAQKMDALGTLAGGIAHDFNNILAAILGYSELAQDELSEGNESLERDLSEIAKAAMKAKNLVRQILTFSRTMEAQKRPVSINKAAEESAAILVRTLPKMIDLELDLQKDLSPVTGDPQQLEQVFINLATNAADAMGGRGRIVISTRDVDVERQACQTCGKELSGEHVLITLSDSGVGMSPEVRAKIFDPFFTTKGVGKGTGLGLSTVYGIVAGHGGHICCQSREGEGTDFLIHLPAVEQAKSEPISEDLDGSTDLGGSGTILLVDDDDAVRDVAQNILTRGGYEVLSATSGEEALVSYKEREGAIDLVLLDLGMPGMGGKACLGKLRRIDPEVKVLIASGYIQYELTDELQSLGALGMVSKPYRKADILQAVREALVWKGGPGNQG